jgi:CopG family nickel-responsive transcriptional regulator
MQRFTISLDDRLAEDFDRWIGERRYANRSEAVRDLFRAEIERATQRTAPATHCVASLSYVYDRDELDVARQLTALHHDHHDLVVSGLQVPLDHQFRMETLALRGKASVVRRFADSLCALRGVRHGSLNLISVELHQRHRHEAEGGERGAGATAPHLHLRPAH